MALWTKMLAWKYALITLGAGVGVALLSAGVSAANALPASARALFSKDNLRFCIGSFILCSTKAVIDVPSLVVPVNRVRLYSPNSKEVYYNSIEVQYSLGVFKKTINETAIYRDYLEIVVPSLVGITKITLSGRPAVLIPFVPIQNVYGKIALFR